MTKIFVHTIAISFLLFSFGLLQAHAFPELVRHGYTNCTTCHISPNGGGVLTEYGRALSKEILSTWGTEKEAQTAYFIDKMPSWLSAGGDIRTLYLYNNNPSFEEGKTIFMQADLETYATVKDKFLIGGTAGIREIKKGTEKEYKYISRRFFALYKFDDEFAVRIGRFFPAFGINIPDHAVVTKRSLGFDQSQESLALEFSYNGDSWSHFLTGVYEQPTKTRIQRERGVAWRSALNLSNTYKIGASYYYAESDLEKKQLAGIFAILGFTERLFLLSELDFRWLEKKHGIVSYQRLAYELYQGLIASLLQENAALDFRDSRQNSYSHGLGLQWFPRPHLEFSMTYSKQKSAIYNRRYTDLAWALFHFYF